MPTRTQVIQTLRARDELQNRDIALILDYLEQEANDSSSTRSAILRNRRRIQDEVTERDLTAIYNYLAELGTPANTIARFLNRLARRRDIVSRKLVNLLMDEIDASTFAPVPPNSPTYWYDFTDISQLYQDAPRIVPVTAAGQNVLGMTNKGSAADVLSVGITNGPTYRIGGLNSLSYGEFVLGNSETLVTPSPTLTWTTQARTFLCVYAFDNEASTGPRYVMSDDESHQQMSCQINEFGTADPQLRISGIGRNFASLSDTQIVAGIAQVTQNGGGGNDPSEFRIHYENNNQTGLNTIVATAGATGLILGANETPANFFSGRLYEAVAWVNGPQPSLDDLETYVTDKFGLVWA
jgi:hypothetical protein